MTEIKGWHVFAGFVFAFSIIISVNLTLAFNAVRTFPGLEVKNSYVASQSFEADQTPEFTFDGKRLVAPVEAGPGNWNLRLTALAADGTEFRQRIVVKALP